MLGLADRYSSLIETALHEDYLLRIPRRITEHELQARWFAGEFGRDFTSTDGRGIRVVQAGVWNHEAGPDFADAAICIADAEPIRGCIEIDPDARDWERHGHATNPSYESVILHVFVESSSSLEFFTRTPSHRLVPQVRLDLSRLLDDPPTPEPSAKPGRCIAPLRDLPEDKVREVLLGAAEHRLRRKALSLARVTELHGSDEALYQGLATTLGYKSNKLPFTLLAQRLPLALLRAQGVQTDALLFGVAGFLPNQNLAEFDQGPRSYLRALWEQWWPRRGEFDRLILPKSLWKFAGQRPANHPQRRLAALGQIVRNWPKIRALRQRCDPGAISDFFRTLRDEFWDFHYTVNSKSTPRRMALIGETRVTEMLANVFYPLAFGEDSSRWLGFKKLRASSSNRRVDIATVRLFGPNSARAHHLIQSAAIQQGLLQVYEDFCQQDASDCAACRFPSQLAKW